MINENCNIQDLVVKSADSYVCCCCCCSCLFVNLFVVVVIGILNTVHGSINHCFCFLILYFDVSMF